MIISSNNQQINKKHDTGIAVNIHEYQAKQLLSDYGLTVPPGLPAFTLDEAVKHAKTFGDGGWVVKAQVHAGGRGKAGGVKLAHNLDELRETAKKLLGSNLITKQSAPSGQPVNCVLIQKMVDIKAEFYLGMLIDRATRRVTLMASAQGGMDIEEVAATDPKAIISLSIEPTLGLLSHQARQVAYTLGLDKTLHKTLFEYLKNLYQLFIDKDLSLIEINPFILTEDQQLMALDAKISIDDNALFRQPDLQTFYDASQEDSKENKAREFDLNYVTLDGNIACMVNGAGLAMATMDIIKLNGGDPANFLDVGGGATAERVAEAFKLIVSDKNVEAILVNIFGGIVRCDLIAEGIIKAVSEVGVELPVIVRLEGTKVNEGKRLLNESDLSIISADDLNDAAAKAVTASKGSS